MRTDDRLKQTNFPIEYVPLTLPACGEVDEISPYLIFPSLQPKGLISLTLDAITGFWLQPLLSGRKRALFLLHTGKRGDPHRVTTRAARHQKGCLFACVIILGLCCGRLFERLYCHREFWLAFDERHLHSAALLSHYLFGEAWESRSKQNSKTIPPP